MFLFKLISKCYDKVLCFQAAFVLPWSSHNVAWSAMVPHRFLLSLCCEKATCLPFMSEGVPKHILPTKHPCLASFLRIVMIWWECLQWLQELQAVAKDVWNAREGKEIQQLL